MSIGQYIGLLTQFLFSKSASFNIKIGANRYSIVLTDLGHRPAPVGLSFALQLVGYLVEASDLESGMSIPFKAGSSEYTVTVTQL